jgi:hypothetical protein
VLEPVASARLDHPYFAEAPCTLPIDAVAALWAPIAAADDGSLFAAELAGVARMDGARLGLSGRLLGEPPALRGVAARDGEIDQAPGQPEGQPEQGEAEQRRGGGLERVHGALR